MASVQTRKVGCVRERRVVVLQPWAKHRSRCERCGSEPQLPVKVVARSGGGALAGSQAPLPLPEVRERASTPGYGGGEVRRWCSSRERSTAPAARGAGASLNSPVGVGVPDLEVYHVTS